MRTFTQGQNETIQGNGNGCNSNGSNTTTNNRVLIDLELLENN